MQNQSNHSGGVPQDILGGDDWTVIVLQDRAELVCTLTRTCLSLQLYEEVIGYLPFQKTEELLDAETMSERVEEEVGLAMDPDDWQVLLNSTCVHHSRGDWPKELGSEF